MRRAWSVRLGKWLAIRVSRPIYVRGFRVELRLVPQNIYGDDLAGLTIEAQFAWPQRLYTWARGVAVSTFVPPLVLRMRSDASRIANRLAMAAQ